MKKIVYSESLKNRLKAAKANGSEIATIILDELKKSHDVALPGSKANYFDTVLIRNCGIPNRLNISCCNKTDNSSNPNHGNPQFQYIRENRTRIDLITFATYFDAVVKAINSWDSTKTDYEEKLFNECMLIGEKITFRVGSTIEDFKYAYLAGNYLPFSNESTLANSCMRHEALQDTIGDFYSLFAGAKILIGQTASGQVVSRAILWDGLEDATATDSDVPVDKFIDRVYVTHSHLYKRMTDEAFRLGYRFKKYRNTYDSQLLFTDMKENTRVERVVYKKVPVSKWHRGGAPYCDTMCNIVYDKTLGNVLLSNSYRPFGGCENLYNLQSTGGYGSRGKSICPVCGEVHSESYNILCPSCQNKLMQKDFRGEMSLKRSVTINGIAYPREMTSHGRLTKLAQLVNNLEKIGVR